jgi:hypothetical protein
MGAGYNSANDIKAFVNTIYEDAMLVARDNSFVTGLVRVFNDRMGTALRTRSDYGTVTFNAIGDTDDLSSQSLTPATGSSLTPYEYGAQIFIPDLRAETDPFPIRQDATQELGGGMGQFIQTTVLGYCSSLTGGTIGTGSTPLTWSDIFAAQAMLRAQRAPMPYSVVLHPYQWLQLGTAVAPGNTATNAPALQNQLAGNFITDQANIPVWSGQGVSIWLSADISAGTAAVGGMWSRDGLAFDVRRGLRIEPERDASRRGWELNASMVFATGAWRPKFGVKLIGDASTPS